MFATRLIPLVLVAPFLFAAAKEQPDPSADQRTSERRRALETYVQQMEALLEKQTQSVARTSSSEEVEMLQEEHREWKRERDLRCAQEEGGDTAGIRELECIADSAELRFEHRQAQIEAVRDQTGPTRLVCRQRVSTSNARPVSHIGREEHAVLNALLRDRYSSAQNQLALQLETVSIKLRASQIDSLRSEFARKSPDVEFPAELVESFCENNVLPKLLEPSRLTLPEGVTLSVQNGRASKGPKVYSSSVGLSQDRQYALVHLETRCGLLCGGGGFYLLQKQAHDWKVIAKNVSIN